LLGRRWAWYAALVPQVVLIAAGALHLALLVLGVLFLLLWLYMLSVRRAVLAPPRRTGPRPDR
jgi:threonine/homoserine/homoserine lactone efflux protein